jgi:type III restriction enzyme
MIGIDKLFDFQEKTVETLLDMNLHTANGKKGIIVKSPTGSGKTLILLEYIDRYYNQDSENKTVFIWFCPGAGELEEQSKLEMEKRLKQRPTLDLAQAIASGFSAGDTVFINWEQVNKTNNKAITESEKKNLIDRIKTAHISGLKFIVIVDEEHSNKTNKTADIVNYFSADYIIRVSATAEENKKYDWYKIDEDTVIRSGLITKAIWINEGIDKNAIFLDPNKYLLEKADEKRKKILEAYQQNNIDINPLVIIQFPNNSDSLIQYVESCLNEMGYTYSREIASYMSENHINADNIKKNNSSQIFLLIKQAISTGWNCPRAKILVKLRENMLDNFTIQTVGRIRRMPETKHYDNEVLDNCFIYTFDENFKKEVCTSIDSAYEVKRIHLKEKCKTFTLEKENKTDDFLNNDQKETYDLLFKNLSKMYNLSNNCKTNEIAFSNNEYIIEDTIYANVHSGIAHTSDDLNKIPSFKISIDSNNFTDIEYRRVIDDLRKIVHISYESMREILKKLFLKSSDRGKILSLNKDQYKRFIINNEKKLKEDFKNISSGAHNALITIIPKKSTFRIPQEELACYDSLMDSNKIINMLSNSYIEYTNEFISKGLRSKPERLFESYCEKQINNVDWVYKNGDSGMQYFSIVYLEGFNNQHLFYPDYVVKLKDNSVWLIETKGGELDTGISQNIDEQSKNKFDALKEYCNRHDMNFGFVRSKDINDHYVLYINNTNYTENMDDDSWIPLEKII